MRIFIPTVPVKFRLLRDTNIAIPAYRYDYAGSPLQQLFPGAIALDGDPNNVYARLYEILIPEGTVLKLSSINTPKLWILNSKENPHLPKAKGRRWFRTSIQVLNSLDIEIIVPEVKAIQAVQIQ